MAVFRNAYLVAVLIAPGGQVFQGTLFRVPVAFHDLKFAEDAQRRGCGHARLYAAGQCSRVAINDELAALNEIADGDLCFPAVLAPGERVESQVREADSQPAWCCGYVQ